MQRTEVISLQTISDPWQSIRMSRTTPEGNMKMLRCSSSLDKNAVLMSFDTNFHLTPRLARSPRSVQTVWSSRNCSQVWVLKSQDTEACFGCAGGVPRHPSSSHHSIFVSLLVHIVKNFVVHDCNSANFALQKSFLSSSSSRLLRLVSLHPSLRRSLAYPSRKSII